MGQYGPMAGVFDRLSKTTGQISFERWPSVAGPLFVPLHPCLPILSFRGSLQALQGFVYAGSDSFRAKFFEKPTPPARRENEVSTVLDAATCCVGGRAGDGCFLLQPEGEETM